MSPLSFGDRTGKREREKERERERERNGDPQKETRRKKDEA